MAPESDSDSDSASSRRRPFGKILLLLGVLACVMLSTSLAAFLRGTRAPAKLGRSGSSLRQNLGGLLPNDLDDFSPVSMTREAFLNTVAAQILLFAGFSPATGQWVKGPPQSLSQRVQSIQPTWKKGPVDYSPDGGTPSAPGGLPLFKIANAGATALSAGSTVASMAAELEAKGLRKVDLDARAWEALGQMLSWRLLAPVSQPTPEPPLALLAFSFDATPSCRTLLDCPLPGPSNELLASTVEQFCNTSAHVEVYAQWEIAAALHRSGRVPADRVHPAGAPGLYMNTVQILEAMVQEASKRPKPRNLVVLAHPDHLRRATRTVQTFLGQRATPFSDSAVAPAMAPYDLDWPQNRSEGASLNLFSGVSSVVHSQGREVAASWYSANLGYFPDGDPQLWVHSREAPSADRSRFRAEGVHWCKSTQAHARLVDPPVKKTSPKRPTAPNLFHLKPLPIPDARSGV